MNLINGDASERMDFIESVSSYIGLKEILYMKALSNKSQKYRMTKKQLTKFEEIEAIGLKQEKGKFNLFKFVYQEGTSDKKMNVLEGIVQKKIGR